ARGGCWRWRCCRCWRCRAGGVTVVSWNCRGWSTPICCRICCAGRRAIDTCRCGCAHWAGCWPRWPWPARRGVASSRLDRARYKAHDLLAGNRDGLNALIGYAGEAFVVAPLTSDANSLSDLLDAMAPDTMPVDGNNAAAAIALGTKLMHDAKAGGG